MRRGSRQWFLKLTHSACQLGSSSTFPPFFLFLCSSQVVALLFIVVGQWVQRTSDGEEAEAEAEDDTEKNEQVACP